MLGDESVSVRILLSSGHAFRVHLVHGIVLSVHGHVQSCIEYVLVIRSVQLRRDLCAVHRFFARHQRHGIRYASQLDLKLKAAVLVEVPVERILVVANCGDEGNDKASGATDLNLLGAPISVLPQDAVVLLV